MLVELEFFTFGVNGFHLFVEQSVWEVPTAPGDDDNRANAEASPEQKVVAWRYTTKKDKCA